MISKADTAYVLVYGVEPLMSYEGDDIVDQNNALKYFFKRIKYAKSIHPLKKFSYKTVLKGFERAWTAQDFDALKSADSFAKYLEVKGDDGFNFKKGFGSH